MRASDCLCRETGGSRPARCGSGDGRVAGSLLVGVRSGKDDALDGQQAPVDLAEFHFYGVQTGVEAGVTRYSVPPRERSRFAVGVCPRLANHAA